MRLFDLFSPLGTFKTDRKAVDYRPNPSCLRAFEGRFPLLSHLRSLAPGRFQWIGFPEPSAPPGRDLQRSRKG